MKLTKSSINTTDDAMKWITDNDISALDLTFVGPDGLKHRLGVMNGGIKSALKNGANIHAGTIPGIAVDGFDGDVTLVPDLNTLVNVPMYNSEYGKVASVMCDVMMPDKSRAVGDSRGMLKDIVSGMSDVGVSNAVIGLECEFYLTSPNAKTSGKKSFAERACSVLGKILPFLADKVDNFNGDKGDYMYDGHDYSSGTVNVRRHIAHVLKTMGINVIKEHHEGKSGHCELVLEAMDAVSACDSLLWTREVIISIAKEHGYVANLEDKPFLDMPGSGMHINVSLVDENDKNLFIGEEEGELSDIGETFVTGVLDDAHDTTLITNPTDNSFERLDPNMHAPNAIAFGDDRYSILRKPDINAPDETRVEARHAGMGGERGNTFRIVGNLLASGIEGVRRGKVNLSPRGFLPKTKKMAIAAFMKGESAIKKFLHPDTVKFIVDNSEKEIG